MKDVKEINDLSKEELLELTKIYAKGIVNIIISKYIDIVIISCYNIPTGGIYTLV